MVVVTGRWRANLSRVASELRRDVRTNLLVGPDTRGLKLAPGGGFWRVRDGPDFVNRPIFLDMIWTDILSVQYDTALHIRSQRVG